MLQNDDFSYPAHGSSPLQVVVMLYDNALSSMKASRAAMKAGDQGRKTLLIDRSEQIVTALMNCLDIKGEMAVDLRSLYCYVLNELAEAREDTSTTRIERCELVMKDLRNVWLELEACMLPDSGFGSGMAA
jgi:flagellar protein FliS